MRRLAVFLLGAAASFGQIAGPQLGWLTENGQIRPILGLPGAAAIGSAIGVGHNLGMMAVSPRQDYVLAADADSGVAVVIVPGLSVSPIPGAAFGASRITMSPRGSAAALWFDANCHFEIVSGLPDAPVVREIDTTFLGAPVAMAVSDDGALLAGAWESGVYTFGPDGAVNRVSPEGDVDALAFYAGRSDLVLATAMQILSVVNGTVSVVYQQADAPPRRRVRGVSASADIATSFDNRWIVRASRTGTILTIDSTTGAPMIQDCGCAPEGVFGLGGSVFRLTSRDVKIVDTAAGSIFAVPPSAGPGTATAQAVTAAISQIPPLTIGGLPTSPGYKQQPGITVTLAAPYTTALTGTLTLGFSSSVGGDDQMIQFANSAGGRTATFAIAAGSTQASFSGSSSIPVQTGTVAGTITLTITSVTSAGTDVTPSPQQMATITTNPTVPFIQTVVFSQTSGGLTVKVNGFSSSRDMVSGLFHFAPASNASIPQSDVTVPLSSPFTTWYQNTASNQFGSQFSLTVPFSVQGNPSEIVAVTVTLTSSKGASNPASPQ
jgi:hypothetical protein